MEARLKQMEEKLDLIVGAVLGDPTDETKPGLLIRLDRLERSYMMMKKAMMALGGGFVTIVATIIATFILRVM